MKRLWEEARPEIIGGLVVFALTTLITWMCKQYARVDIWAMVFVAVVGLWLGFGYLIFRHFQQKRPPSKIIILVADFDGPETEHYGVTIGVLNNLRQALRPYDDVQIKALGRPITEREGSAVARSKGEKHKATIVIWGWYRTPGKVVPMSVNFEVLRPPLFLPELGSEAKGELRRMAMAELTEFELQINLSKEMACLSLFTVGTARYAAADWDGAIDCYDDALSQTVERVAALDRSAAHFFRGDAYMIKGDYEQAIKDYDQAIALRPEHAMAYNNRGIVYKDKGDNEQAIKDFDQAIALRPDDAAAYINRGNVYKDKGDNEQAIKDYDQAIALRPDDAAAYNSRGLAYMSRHCDHQAIKDFNQAIALRPDDAAAHINRGVVYRDKGDYDQAIKDFNQAIKLQSDFDDLAYGHRAYAYRNKGEKKKAAVDFKRVLELSDSPIWRELAKEGLKELEVK